MAMLMQDDVYLWAGAIDRLDTILEATASTSLSHKFDLTTLESNERMPVDLIEFANEVALFRRISSEFFPSYRLCFARRSVI